MLKCCFGMDYTELLDIIEHAVIKRTTSTFSVTGVQTNTCDAYDSYLDHFYYDLEQILESVQSITQNWTTVSASATSQSHEKSVAYFSLDEKCNSIVKKINSKLS